jgi:Ca-activated chloride channel homolog
MQYTSQQLPKIEVIPERPFLAAGREQTVTLLVRITAPEPAARAERPKLNLCLVLDRSGSMGGEKMGRARDAACYCVDQLLPSDRLGVVTFDDEIDVLIESRSVTDKGLMKQLISRVDARNSTALHQAWVTGGMEVSRHLDPAAVNRVLLITDGLANVGETNTDVIVSQAAGLASRGVTTSTVGIGADFNEDLLIPMAEAGKGNAWHVVEPRDMERIFATELEGLLALFGHTVSLGLTPADGAKVADVMNDFEVAHTGRYKLPDLQAGSPVEVVVNLKVPAGRAGQGLDALGLRLAWNPQQAAGSPLEKAIGGGREVLTQGVRLEYAEAERAEATAPDERVVRAVEMLTSARARREAVRHLDRGDRVAALRAVAFSSKQMERYLERSGDAQAAEQVQMLRELEQDIAESPVPGMARKKLSYQSRSLRDSKKTK